MGHLPRHGDQPPREITARAAASAASDPKASLRRGGFFVPPADARPCAPHPPPIRTSPDIARRPQPSGILRQPASISICPYISADIARQRQLSGIIRQPAYTHPPVHPIRPPRCSVPGGESGPAARRVPADTARSGACTARSRRMTIVRIRFAPNSRPAPSGPTSEPRTATIPRPQFAHPPQRPPAPPQRKTVKTGAQRTIFPINSYICNRLTPSPKWI